MTVMNESFSGRVLVVAFEGWSDAGNAASGAAQWMLGLLNHAEIAALSAEDFVDYQMHRPRLEKNDTGTRQLHWPDTKLYGPVERPNGPETPATTAGEQELIRTVDGSEAKNLFILLGAEPSRRWRAYVAEVMTLVQTWQIDHIVFLGSLFADTPHSRPIATTLSSENPALRARYGFEQSDYEGPAGVGSALALAAYEAGVDHVSVWASVPHYVHSAPSPKATLALLDQIEELLDVVIPRGELIEQSNDWEANISALAASDRDMADYIERLEEARDTVEGPESTGEAIAHEFEKFLRRDRGDEAPAATD